MKLSMIAAMSTNRCIGVNNQLPWHFPEDLRFFKKTTLNKPIIMGRKTHESIGFALPHRKNIVLTRNPNYQANGCTVLPSLTLALNVVHHEPEAIIIGGANLYQQALPLANTIYLTIIDTYIEGDSYFPLLDEQQWQDIEQDPHQADKNHPFDYCFHRYQRRPLID